MGDEVPVIVEILRVGWAGVFLWLYIQERNRARELSDSRMEVMKQCNEILVKHIEEKH